MNNIPDQPHQGYSQPTRREFLSDLGMGFTGLALGAMLADDGRLRSSETSTQQATTHFRPRAKSVIWIFLSGGYSHLETFDPKPALNKYAGMTFDETPFADPFASPVHDKRSRSVIEKVREKYPTILPQQVGFKPYGDSGIEVGVREHQYRRIAAQLHRALHDLICGLFQQNTADLG